MAGPRKGKCINFGMCPKADTREEMTIAADTDFVCPECEKPLTASTGGGAGNGGGSRRLLLFGIPGLLLMIAIGAWLLWPKPDPIAAIDQALERYYPDLPK